MLLFMGLLFSYVFVISARLIPSIRLLGADKTTRGLVLDVEETNSSVNDVTVFKNTFRFSLDEKEYTQYSFTTGKIYSRGDRVTIEYLSDDPEFSIIKGTSYSVFGFFPIFVIILPVVGYSIIFNSRPYHIRKYIKLLKKGKLTKARVAYIKRRGNKCHYYYQYHDEKGIEKTGKYVTDDIKFSKPGEMLPIIYCSTWYECSRYLEKPISHISYQSDSWNLNLGNEKFWTALGFWALDKLSFIILAAFVYYIFQSML
jgi:hypothetical protein